MAEWEWGERTGVTPKSWYEQIHYALHPEHILRGTTPEEEEDPVKAWEFEETMRYERDG